MLTATKREVEEVAALLEAGAASPEDLAKLVIKRITELREERKCYVLVMELTPGVYSGYGPFATISAAVDSTVKNPMAYIAKRAAVVPLAGHKPAVVSMEEVAAKPPTSRVDPEVALDREAFKRGWKGNMRDRGKYLQVVT